MVMPNPPTHAHKTLPGQKAAAPHCAIHTDVALVCPACWGASGGAIGGRVTSKAKARSSARNGRLGGRPRLPEHRANCKRKEWGAFDPTCRGCQARVVAEEERRDAERRNAG